MSPCSDGELEALVMDLESDRAERQESAADDQEIRRSICAFANDLPRNRRPGFFFIGVRDDGSCASLPTTDDLLSRLANIRGEGSILPTAGIAATDAPLSLPCQNDDLGLAATPLTAETASR